MADLAVRVPVLLFALLALWFLGWLVYAAFTPRHVDRDEARFLLATLAIASVFGVLVWGLANGGEVW